MKSLKSTLIASLFGFTAAQPLLAADVDVTTNITTSTTWVNTNEYHLVGQIFVTDGATLTIEPGTKIKSRPVEEGSLAVTRGSKIIAVGTPTNPIIFTSTSDDLVTERTASSEWGNLTIMGRGLVGNSLRAGNTATPTGLNVSQMEGLSSIPNDPNPNVLFGGNDDNDDSGSLAYVSLRYTGKVLGFGNELNGLSLGGIGRETDIHHINIFSGVDDGIEIWGGTVNVKYASIWNIGDDSVDVDQGWRGKMQFILIVQGRGNATTSQGGGIGDNLFEMDGAENSDAQPVTTAVIYNATAIGQPNSATGDHGTAWRDGARVQFRNCIFMDLGDNLVNFDNVDGDGSNGYGFNGTLPWLLGGASNDVWDTPHTARSTVNDGGLTAEQLNAIYAAQTSGFLCEITDSVFFNNVNSAYSNANGSDAVGVTIAGGSNPAINNIVATMSPIVSITRGADIIQGGFTIKPVTALDPRAANDAVTSAAAAPADGFFTPANFRGAFSSSFNWLKGWTAEDAYGLITSPANPAEPAATIALTATTSFQTVLGVTYVVESSNDGITWTPIDTLVGDGTIQSITDLAAFDNSKMYRAVPQ